MHVLLKLFRGDCFANVSDRYEVDRRLQAGYRANLRSSEEATIGTLLAPCNDYMTPGSVVGIKEFVGH